MSWETIFKLMERQDPEKTINDLVRYGVCDWEDILHCVEEYLDDLLEYYREEFGDDDGDDD